MRKTMMVLSLILALFTSTNALAQGVDFLSEGTTWAEAVAKAKADNKLLFIDCYTQWCGPCKSMSKNVFPQEIVGQFMNPSYVSLKIDMEAGEGPELLKKWQVSAFPTFIIFNGDGQEVGRFLGGSDAEGFIQKVKDASVDNGNASMDARFAAGERDEAFLYEYLETLNASYKRDQCNLVAEALLEGKEDSFTSDQQLTKVFMTHLTNPFCPAFVVTAKDPSKLKAAVGEPNADRKLSMTFKNYGKSLIVEKDGTATMDEAKLQQWQDLMAECGSSSDEVEVLRLTTLIQFDEKKKDWCTYMSHVNEYCGKFDALDLELCKWGKPIAEECKDEQPRQQLVVLLQQRLEDLRSGKREPQTRMGNMMLSGNLDKAMEMLIEHLTAPVE